MSRWLYLSLLIASSCKQRLRFAAGRVDSAAGSTISVLDPAAAAGYINRTFDDYLRYGNLTAAGLQGARLLELGPGDNSGVGLRFLSLGTAYHATIDKFYSERDKGNEKKIYEQVRAQLDDVEARARFDAAVSLAGAAPVFHSERLRTVHGVGAQDAHTVFPEASFDGVISRAVLHEIYEAEAVFRSIDRVLKPGGWMLHKIDLRDDGLFSNRGFHPLEFLTISDPVYWLMAYDTDKPCRRPLPFYRDILRNLGYEARFPFTGIIEPAGYQAVENPSGAGKETLVSGVDYGEEHRQMLQRIRPRLASAYRSLSDSDLLAASIFVFARKPS